MKKILRIIATFLITIILLLIAALGFLQTGTGQKWISSIIPKFAPNISISGLTGSIPVDMQATDIKISDKQGVWLEIENVHLAWNPLLLIRGEWRINSLEAGRIRMLRKPVSEKDKEQKEFSLPSIPNLTLKKINIPEVIVEPSVAGQRQRFMITGHGNASNYQFNARSLEGTQTILDARVIPGHGTRLKFNEAPGGLFTTLLKLPDNASINANLHANEQSGKIQLSETNIQLGKTTISGMGNYTLNNKALDGQFNFSMPDISEFSKLSGTKLSGELRGILSLSGKLSKPQVVLEANGPYLSVSGQEISEVRVQGKWIENCFELNGTAEHNAQPASIVLQGKHSETQIDANRVELVYGMYQAQGRATINMADRQFDTSFTMKNVPLKESPSKKPFKLTTELEAKGSFDQFNVTSEAKAILPEGNIALNGKGDINLKQQQFVGTVAGKGTTGKAQFTLDTLIHGDAKAVQLQKLALKGDGISLAGQGVWQAEQKLANAKLILSATDLRPLGRLLDFPLAGQVDGNLLLTPKEGEQQGELRLKASSLKVDTIMLDKLNVLAQANKAAFSVKADTDGTTGGKPLSLALALQGNRTKTKTDVTLQTLKGIYAGMPFGLQKSARLQLLPDQQILSDTTIALAGGNLQLKGIIKNNIINANIALRNIALEKLPADLPPGDIQALLKLSGKTDQPKASLIANGSLSQGKLPIAFNLKSQWQADQLTADANVNSQNKPLITAKASIVAPFSLIPMNIGLNAVSPIKGSLSFLNTPLNLFNRTLYSKGMKVDGTLNGAGNIAGSLGTPKIQGKLALANGRFHHPDTGICLKGVSATILANQNSLSLNNFTASSPNGSLKGNMTWGFANGGVLNGNVGFAHFPLFCGGIAKGEVDGNLMASGTSNASHLSGELTLGPLNIQLPGSAMGQPQIPKVKTVMVTDFEASRVSQKATAPLMLNIVLNAPNRLFMRGRGLDAEFSGKLTIKGPATDPAFEGDFKTQRGTFTLFDHQLKLVDSVLRFNGSIPPSPFLDIKAETTADNTAITVALTGPVNQPEFSFTSSPALPQDEIFALLLFGRDLSNLSPFQALQLAQSVAELSGKSSGSGGILGKLGSILGIDQLGMGSGAGSNSLSMGGGKYLNDKVYVGISQGANPEDRAIITEIELSPWASATSSVDAQGHQGIGVQWKYDY